MEKDSIGSALRKLLFGKLNEGQKIVALLFAILVVLILGFYFNYRVSKMIEKKNSPGPLLLGPAALNPQPEPPPPQAEVKKPPEEALRDPFLPTGSIAATEYKEALKLESILTDPYDPSNSRAMINGNLVQAGDTISGAKVLRIEPERVILKQGDKEIILPLWEE